MAGVVAFVTSFFANSQNSEAEESNGETENFGEGDNRIKEFENQQDSDDNQQSSQERIICKFYLQGKCRFGEKCKNIHEGSQVKENIEHASSKRSPQSKRDDDKKTGGGGSKKKPPMRTAADVINRIKWDALLPEEFFVVGYLDRFLGVQEEAFTAFCWEDLASLDWDVLAIPQHRIQYFKYKTEKVWDKSQRLDTVFGSTGSQVTILELMERVDTEIAETRRAELQRECSCWSEEEEEEEEEVTFSLPARLSTEQQVSSLLEEERSTHFIAVRITEPELVARLGAVQREMVGREAALAECCMRPGLLHLTLAMLRLTGEDAAAAAQRMMHGLRAELQPLLAAADTSLEIAGLNNFGQRVVYAEVRPRDPATLAAVRAAVLGRVSEAGPGVASTERFEFVPHVTLAKVSRPVARLRRSQYIDSSCYDLYSEAVFGRQPLDNLQLCIIESTTRYDGFYSTLSELQF